MPQVQAPLRDLGSLRKNYRDFIASGGNKENAKNFFSVVSAPMLEGADSDLVLTKLPIAELHIFLGLVNHILKYLDKAADNFDVKKWIKDVLKIDSQKYHGGTYEGPDCQKILKNLSKLHNALPDNLKKFAVALDRFSAVKSACFGMKLYPDWEEKIDRFAVAFRQLKIPESPKAHVLIQHVPQFIKATGMPLGPFSEQASESVHSDFKDTAWKRYKVGEEKDSYPQRLLSSVINYIYKRLDFNSTLSPL